MCALQYCVIVSWTCIGLKCKFMSLLHKRHNHTPLTVNCNCVIPFGMLVYGTGVGGKGGGNGRNTKGDQ